MVGRIKINRATQGHKELLESKGYVVSEEDGHYVVEAGGFVSDDEPTRLVTTEERKAFLSSTVENKLLFSYKHKFVFASQKEDGEEKVLFGVLAARYLGKVSCLMAKGEAKKRNTIVTVDAEF